MDIHEILQTAGQYCYVAFQAVSKQAGKAHDALAAWIASLPLPTSIKLFGNEAVNLNLFFGIVAFLLVMNIWSFTLFARDKSKAKRKERRVSEKKMMRVCFWGGAIGGIIGMNAFRHKTLKKKFSVGIPILFVIQLILDSFVLGFLAFWTFF